MAMLRAPVVLIGSSRDPHVTALADRVRALGARALVVAGDELAAGTGLAIAASGEVVVDGLPLRPACAFARPLGVERPAHLRRALATWGAAGVAIYDAAHGSCAYGDRIAFVLDGEVIGGAEVDPAVCRAAAAAAGARFARVAVSAGARVRIAGVDAGPDFLHHEHGDAIADRIAARLVGWTRRFPLREAKDHVMVV
jgi:hypothetical protein